jgi:hypothetical protein
VCNLRSVPFCIGANWTAWSMSRLWLRLRNLSGGMSLERPLLEEEGEDSGLHAGCGKPFSNEPESKAVSGGTVYSPAWVLTGITTTNVFVVELLCSPARYCNLPPAQEFSSNAVHCRDSVDLPSPPDSISPQVTINNSDQDSRKKKLVWAGE